MIHLALCDDDASFLEQEAGRIQSYFETNDIQLTLTTYTNGQALLSYAKQNPLDLAFLDIDMPELNGFEVAKQLNHELDCLLVFVSNHEYLALDSFSYHPFHFIHKPFFETKIGEVLGDFIKRYRQQNTSFSALCNRELITFRTRDVLYLESDHNVVQIHTTHGVYRTISTLTKMEELLSPMGFCRTHAAFLVNLEKVHKIRKEVVLDDGTVLAISQKNLAPLKQQYLEYMRNHL